jgi:hypothetical protein
MRGEGAGLSASLSLWKRPLTPTLSPQAGRGRTTYGATLPATCGVGSA